MKTIYTFIIALCLIPLTGASESWIVDGKIAKPHSRKYMASLQCKGQHFCGGFLIREDFVLTAAHCTCDLPTTVVLGAHNIFKKEPSQQRIEVEKYFKHPRYDEICNNDIMLLKLKQTAKFDKKFVKPIDLPKKDKKIPDSTKCTVAGWGKTKPVKGSPGSDVLREAVEKIKSNKDCEKKWNKYFDQDHMICTKFNKKGGSMCQGDSGGPLICNNKPLGISSCTKPIECDDPEFPHIYTKISSFLPWIQNVMQGLGNVE